MTAAMLLAELRAPDLPRQRVEALSAFNAEAKDEAMTVVAGSPPDQLTGPVVARLPRIRTPENTPALTRALLAGLTAPEPAARRAALFGLEAIGSPDLIPRALDALNDPSDIPVAAAIDALLRRAPDDPAVKQRLRAVAAAHASDAAFYLSRALLDAHGITAP